MFLLEVSISLLSGALALLADNFRDQVEFRGNGEYGLADLVPGGFKRRQTLLKEGEKFLRKW